ncbi:tetratricopeptide repeat protein [Candidatus Desantisbacteria bacterium]|nr:tetratricopeptide repeat protein [Candidatus Desantisbacteria bacterium]
MINFYITYADMEEIGMEVKVKDYFSKCICIIIILFTVTAIKTHAQAFKRFKEGDKALTIVSKTLDGKQINTDEFKQKNTLGVIFWKLGSVRSISALKYLQKTKETYKDIGFTVISVYCPKESTGISSSEIEEVEKILQENNISIPVLLDEGLKVFNNYGVISLPSIMILDVEGTAKYILGGFPKFGAESDISKNVKKILGIPEEAVAKKKYEPKLPASRNYKLANAVLERGNTDKAIEYLKNAISMDPDYADPYALIGKLYLQNQNKELALENYRKALELDPDNNENMIKYGFLCLEAGMNDDSLLVFKTILEKSPDFTPSAHYGIGSVYMQNQVYDSARSESEKAEILYSQANNLSPHENLYYAQTISNLAEIYSALQEKSKAIEAYKKAGKKYEEILGELVNETSTRER